MVTLVIGLDFDTIRLFFTVINVSFLLFHDVIRFFYLGFTFLLFDLKFSLFFVIDSVSG